MPAERPTMSAAHVVLRALRPSDEDAVYSLLSDERVIRHMLFPRFDHAHVRSPRAFKAPSPQAVRRKRFSPSHWPVQSHSLVGAVWF